MGCIINSVVFGLEERATVVPHISLGRLNVAHLSPEFRRVDPDGALTARIVQALAADEVLAEAIQSATFADRPAVG